MHIADESEAVERRRDLRGPVRGLTIQVDAAALDAVEASRRTLFVCVDEPGRWQLGDVLDARIARAGRTAHVRVQVVRTEPGPRRGVALRIVGVDADGARALRVILGPW